MLQKMPAISTNLIGSRRPSLGPSAPCFESPGATPNRLIRVYDVINGRRLANDHVFVDAGPGTPDGLRSDVDGTLWCGWGMGTAELDGVFIYSPEGKLIGRIHLPERCANLCFGGAKHNRLFMAASKSLYSLYVNTQGAAGGGGGHHVIASTSVSHTAEDGGPARAYKISRLPASGLPPETSSLVRLDQIVIVRNRRMITARITIVRLPSTGFP
jgi:hypothetical protein